MGAWGQSKAVLLALPAFSELTQGCIQLADKEMLPSSEKAFLRCCNLLPVPAPAGLHLLQVLAAEGGSHANSTGAAGGFWGVLLAGQAAASQQGHGQSLLTSQQLRANSLLHVAIPSVTWNTSSALKAPLTSPGGGGGGVI